MNHNPEPIVARLSDAAPEQMLVVAAKNGDGQAFETLFKRYKQKILRIVLRYAHVREDAEDIVQQSFQKAFVYLHKFEGKSSFSTWLTRIAINESLMLLRHGRSLREIPVDDSYDQGGAASATEIPDASPDPETSYLRRERVQILSETLMNLRPGLRLAIALRDLTELSTEETARRMGISAAAVKARLFHARRKLTGKIEPLHEVQCDARENHYRFGGYHWANSATSPLQCIWHVRKHHMLKIGFSETLSKENLTAKDKRSLFDQLAEFLLASVVAAFVLQFGTECIATGSYIKHVLGQLIIKRKSSVHAERRTQVIDCVGL